jgi:hypothetical protein
MTRMENGVRIYTSLPITLDDKVDKLQINFDYQQHMEEHQLSFDDCMERSNLNRLIHMGDEPYEIDDPWILKTLTEIEHQDFFVANWMMDHMSTRLNFDMWYNFIGKDLKIPKDLKTQLEEDREEERKWKWDIDHKWKVGGAPELVDRFQIKRESKQTQTEDHKLTVCSLQAGTLPMKTIKPLMDQSHFANEPLFIALSGEALNKQQGRTLYTVLGIEIKLCICKETFGQFYQPYGAKHKCTCYHSLTPFSFNNKIMFIFLVNTTSKYGRLLCCKLCAVHQLDSNEPRVIKLLVEY